MAKKRRFIAKVGCMNNSVNAAQDTHIAETYTSDEADVYELLIDQIIANPDQPRKEFNEDSLMELTEDIEERGILVPLLVAPNVDGTYTLVGGERRLRAAREIGLSVVPVRVLKDLGSEEDIYTVAIADNVQRENLSLLDEAKAYEHFQKMGMSLRQIAKKFHKSASYILKRLRLLEITDETLLQEYLTGRRNLQELIEAKSNPKQQSNRGRPPAVLKPVRSFQDFQAFTNQIVPEKIATKERDLLRETVRVLITECSFASLDGW
jgi:ParB/RepB/Spo0J family partition protein